MTYIILPIGIVFKSHTKFGWKLNLKLTYQHGIKNISNYKSACFIYVCPFFLCYFFNEI